MDTLIEAVVSDWVGRRYEVHVAFVNEDIAGMFSRLIPCADCSEEDSSWAACDPQIHCRNVK